MTLVRIMLATTLMAVSVKAARAVVGGEPAQGGTARALVMVLAEGGQACSGVLITREVVLTAGHCVPRGRPIRVYLPRAGEAPTADSLVVPKAVAVHPDYVPNARGTRRRSVDLALLRLSAPAPAAFGTAILAAGPAPDASTAVSVLGYGLSDEQNERSGGVARDATLTVTEPFGRGTVLLWAQAPPNAPAGACAGDSGGALVRSDGALVAAVAFAEGFGNHHCGKLTQGVLLAPQRSYIDGTLARWGDGAVWTTN